MLRVIGIYRWADGATFNHEYYNSEHMQLTRRLLAPHGLLRLESDRYISSASPVTGDVIAASNAYFPSVDVAQAAIAAVGGDLMEDLKNYTNLRPELRFAVVSSHG